MKITDNVYIFGDFNIPGINYNKIISNDILESFHFNSFTLYNNIRKNHGRT